MGFEIFPVFLSVLSYPAGVNKPYLALINKYTQIVFNEDPILVVL